MNNSVFVLVLVLATGASSLQAQIRLLGTTDAPLRKPYYSAGAMLQTCALQVQEIQNPNTPAARLHALAASPCTHVLNELAQNARTPLATLTRLSYNQSGEVRLNVAGNPNATYDILLRLAQDHNLTVHSRARDRIDELWRANRITRMQWWVGMQMRAETPDLN
jgi:hypothetical protein